MISRYRQIRFAILELNDNWACTAASLQLSRTTTTIPGSTQTEFKAFRQERKHIKHSGLTTAVGSQKHRQGCNIPELNSFQSTVVLDPQVLDPRCASYLVHFRHSVSSHYLEVGEALVLADSALGH